MASDLRVGVIGASGFLGGELVRLLAGHPHAEVVAVAGHSSAGKSLAALRPSLTGLAADTIEPIDAAKLSDRCDLVFTALPHGESASVASRLLEHNVRVIDLGSDFRLADPTDHERYYQRTPPHPELLERAHYSLPELTGAPDKNCALIANPGCFATALALTVTPLTPLLARDARVFVSGVTGSSGSGITPTPRVHHSLRESTLAAYRPLAHQHLGEVTQLIARRHGRQLAIDFVPHSGPFKRGIHLTTAIRAADLTGDVMDRYRSAYQGAALIDLQEGPVQMGAVVGSCRTSIGVVADSDVVVVLTVLDNLLKGGSGQAIQNMNLLYGFPETLGLPTMGMWP